MRRAGLTMLLGIAFAMAGCSHEKAPEPPVKEETPNEPTPAPVVPSLPPERPPHVEPPKEAPPPPANDSAADAPFDESAQTLEDAEATGMTTRTPPSSADEDRPSENAQGEDAAGE